MPVARRGVPQRSRRQTSSKERENPLAINADIVTIEIEEMAQFSESTNICLFGPSGVGKTVLAGGAPRATFLTTEKGLTSAQRSGSQARIMRAYDWEHILAGMNKADEVLGEKDWLIKPSHSQRLFDKAKDPKALTIIKDGGHAERIFDVFPDKFMKICLDRFRETL